MGTSDHVAVKLGYWVKTGNVFHSRNCNFVASCRGLRAFAVVGSFIYTQAPEIISVCVCFEEAICRFNCAIKCSKTQIKEWVRGGKIGVLPRSRCLSFRQAKRLVASLVSTILNNKSNLKSSPHEGVHRGFCTF